MYQVSPDSIVAEVVNSLPMSPKERTAWAERAHAILEAEAARGGKVVGINA